MVSIDDGMNINKISLSFPKDQEKIYQDYYFKDSLRVFRISFLLVILIYGLFGILDTVFATEKKELLYLIRFGIVIPFLLIVFLLSFFGFFKKIWQWLVFSAYIIAGSGIVAMITQKPEDHIYYAGLMLVFSAGYFIVKLRFLLASLAGWSILLIFNVAVIWFSNTPSKMILAYNFVYASANIINMVAAYYIEFFNRRQYYLSRKLTRKKAELEESNKNLEINVKERTKELIENEKKYRDLVEDINDVIFSINSKGIFTYMSPVIKNITGYAPSEYIGSHLSFFIHQDNLKTLLNDIKNLKAGKYYQSDYRVKTISGKNVWFRISVKNVITNNNPVEYRGVAQNITKRKNAEEAFKKSNRRLQSVLQSQKEMICRFNSDTTITYVNNAYCKTIEKPAEELIGQKWIDLVPKDQKSKIVNKLKLLTEGEEDTITYTYKINLPNGAFRWMEWTNYIIRDKAGSFLEFQSVGHDITDTIEKERLEKEVKVARSTLKFKQNFLANMSHEIRTPLTGVLGMAEILKRSKLTHQQEDYLNTLIQSGNNLKEIIDLILDYSKIEAGQVKLKMNQFSLEKLVNDASKLYTPFTDKKNIKIITTISPKIPKLIISDSHRITQVLNNLISNAAKFTEKGKISVNANLIDSLSEDNDNIYIKIEVEDTGMGINAEKKEHIFKPFFQIEQDYNRRIEGTGLGLSICKELTAILGGDIGVESEPGKGSKFWFTFKAKIAQENVKSVRKTNSNDTLSAKSLKILLVEDKIVTQKVVTILLNSIGHEVESVNNGKEALDIFEPGKYDLILMDIQMPVIDGITTTKKLKKKYSDLPPIVGLSANAFEGDREKYIKQGLDEYITKPAKKDDFEKIIKKLGI